MMPEATYTYETTFSVNSPLNDKGETIGDIDVRLHLEIVSWAVPARINFNEHDYPDESAEIEVKSVEMLIDSKTNERGRYVDAWDWLYDQAIDWVNAHADELASEAGEYLQGREDAAMETRFEERK